MFAPNCSFVLEFILEWGPTVGPYDKAPVIKNPDIRVKVLTLRSRDSDPNLQILKSSVLVVRKPV